MGRLTDRATAEALKANAEKLRAAGLEPSEMDKHYIKLAEYENADEPKLYLCDADKRPQCKATACYKNGGCCRLTVHKEFAKTDENGNPVVYESGD